MRDQIRLAVGPWGAEEEQAGRDLTVVGVCIRRKFVVLDSTAHDEVVARLGRDAARRSSRVPGAPAGLGHGRRRVECERSRRVLGTGDGFSARLRAART